MKTLLLLINLLAISEFSFSIGGNDTLNEVTCNQVELRHGSLYGDWHYVINSEKEFRKIIGGRSGIDFSAFTLLGVVTSSGGCQPPEVSHSVKYSKQSDEYFYELKVKVNGLCEPNHLIEIWCTIAKISDSSTVAFSKQE